MTIEIETLESPIGPLLLARRGETVVGLALPNGGDKLERSLGRRFRREDVQYVPPGSAAAKALRRYFDGDVAALDAITVDTGGTRFQSKVWKALREVPAGRTVSYGRLASMAGSPRAMRAVGAAMASNPVAIIVPCHRVIGSDGSLHGYGGGLDRKEWLLAHEGWSGNGRAARA